MKILAIVIAALGCQLCLGQSLTISGRIVDEQHRPVPFANVVLLHGSDTLSMVQGTASDLSGRYAFEGVAPGAYLLKASFVGYKTASARLQAARSRSCDLLLQRDSMSIGEVVVEGERSIRSIDKSSYLFSEAQIAQASDGRELVASLPNLRIDRTSDALATVNGKRLLLLINGIKASDEDLRLIPADKIRKVELYDVPPIRYMNDAERVVNILTKPLDAGWSGNLYGTLGQMFSNASVTLSHVRGDNRFTFHYGAHINMKREVRNRETGRYAYRIGEENYLYDYLRESLKWGHQHNFGLTYTRSREQSYDLQIKASAHTDNEWMEADKRISFARNTPQEERTGRLTDRTESLVPTLDLYFAKYFSERSTLVVNLVGSYFDNRQRTRSTESGTTGFDDLMLLDNRKSSLIGEAAYLHRFSRAQLTVGYRSQCNFLSNRLRNSVSGQPQSERINTQKHYLYAEISGKLHSWLYRASLGATADIRSGEGGFRHLTFTPVVMLGYAIDRANTLRLAYDSDTRMPEMQQMSEARILLMSDFYQTGNAELKKRTPPELEAELRPPAAQVLAAGGAFPRTDAQQPVRLLPFGRRLHAAPDRQRQAGHPPRLRAQSGLDALEVPAHRRQRRGRTAAFPAVGGIRDLSLLELSRHALPLGQLPELLVRPIPEARGHLSFGALQERHREGLLRQSGIYARLPARCASVLLPLHAGPILEPHHSRKRGTPQHGLPPEEQGPRRGAEPFVELRNGTQTGRHAAAHREPRRRQRRVPHQIGRYPTPGRASGPERRHHGPRRREQPNPGRKRNPGPGGGTTQSKRRQSGPTPRRRCGAAFARPAKRQRDRKGKKKRIEPRGAERASEKVLRRRPKGAKEEAESAKARKRGERTRQSAKNRRRAAEREKIKKTNVMQNKR